MAAMDEPWSSNHLGSGLLSLSVPGLPRGEQSTVLWFGRLSADSCTHSQVTYNTLIDVYGKLGQWEQALQVLRRMKYQVRHNA